MSEGRATLTPTELRPLLRGVIAFAPTPFTEDDRLDLDGLAGVEGLTLERIFGFAFAPLALLMGIAPADALEVGSLLGVKTVLNEFLAYQDLAGQIAASAISHRSAVIASYALCGFANFGSLAILLGGVGGMAPGRRADLARLGLRSILSGTLASMMTGCVAGLLL